MSKIGYDLSIAIALVLITGGIWSKWDGATACIAAGALIIPLTFAAVTISRKR